MQNVMERSVAKCESPSANPNPSEHLMTRSFRFAYPVLAIWIGALSAIAQEPGAPASAPADTPAITAIKESNPFSVSELTRAALAAADLDRPDLGRQYAQQIAESKPTVEQAIDAYRKIGTDQLIRLQTHPGLQPAGTQASELVFDLLSKYWSDPTRLDQWIDELSDEDRIVRKRATTELLNAGDFAMVAIIEHLGDAQSSQSHPQLVAMLVRFEDRAKLPILAGLQSDNPVQITNLVAAATKLNSRDFAPFLVGPFLENKTSAEVKAAIATYMDQVVGSRPDTEAAIQLLQERATSYMGTAPMFPETFDNFADFWIWDASASKVVHAPMPMEDAQVVTARRLLDDLANLTNAEEVKVQRAIATLQETAIRPDPPQNLSFLIKEFGIDTIQEALQESLGKEQFLLAATVACYALGETKRAELLEAPAGKISPLAKALQSPSYRIRWAATQAIMMIDRKTPYAGSAEMLSQLVYFAGASGERVAVVADANRLHLPTLAGLFGDLGFRVEASPGGRPLFLASQALVDVELIVMTRTIDPPPVMETIQILRKDRRTGNLPIGLIVAEGNVNEYQLRTDADPLTHVLIAPQDRQALTFYIREMYLSQGRQLVPAEERVENAATALGQLAQLAENHAEYSFYNLLKAESVAIHQIGFSALTEKAARVLSHLPTPLAQVALMDHASNHSVSIEYRQAVAKYFEDSVKRHGVLLTKEQILAQYNRYNQSENLGAETQQVLGKVLDIIEAPTKDVRFDQPAVARP